MARGGFLSRITNAIKRVWSGPERKPPGPPPSVPPTIDYIDVDRWRAEWNEYKFPRRYGSFKKHKNLIIDWDEGYNIDDPDEQFEDWKMYLKYMLAGESEYRRNDPRNEFWQYTGMDPGDFDWDAWRSIMGYSRAKAS